MKTEEKKRTADVLMEKAIWIKVGWIPVRFRPLTLAQIYEIGRYANDIDGDGIELNKRINVVAAMFAKFKNAPLMRNVFVVCAFRSRLPRFIFKYYIKRHLRTIHLKKMMDYISQSYDANFFLTSIIFLKQMNLISEPNQTTAHGQQWEEL